MNKPARFLSVLTTVALAAATLSVTTSGGAQGAATGARGAAVDRLKGDAQGSLKIVRSRAGDVTFVGTAAGQRIDNPAVKPSMSVRAAAESHLSRYGAALGIGRVGTTLSERRVTPTQAGAVVRYVQKIHGLPVLGGDVVVSVDKAGELLSLLSTTSDEASISPVQVTEQNALRLARTMTERRVGRTGLDAVSSGRAVLDPDVVAGATVQGPRSVWRISVGDGGDVRHEVLIDDQTGAVLLDIDQIQTIDRVVCDRANVGSDPNAAAPACTSGFARTEASGPSGVHADVNNAFDFAGAASTFYGSVGVDLTALVGRDVAGLPKLATTTRFCYTGSTCPYNNAFWNGDQTYFGQGWTVDEIVGHEWTHGVIENTNELLYWGQSGAINESLSDIVGEIVDHRTPTAGDSPTDFQLAEDSPIGSFRNLQDPTVKNDPDRTQSGLWVADRSTGCYMCDNGGVHSNSGVGNKTAYLIMKGGVFNGQSITGLDAGNDTFPKTARLYMLVIQSLASGADYADLGLVLDQSCNTLVGVSGSGFTAADCVNVHKATLATELAQTPANAPTPPDPSTSCPAGTGKVVLFDSESGTPSTKFTPSGVWQRTADPDWGSNVHSLPQAWNHVGPYNGGAMAPASEALVMVNPVTVPASGAQTFMVFHQWYFLDFYFNGSGTPVRFDDGGTVDVDDLSTPAGPLDAATLPWVNGPPSVLWTGTGNPAAGRLAFAGDSRGWYASRVDLSSFAGKSIKPQFTFHRDNMYNVIGWFVDDITIYSCVAKVVAGSANIKGKLLVGKKLKAKTAGWTAGATFAYQWLRNGKVISGGTERKYKLTAKDKNKKMSVRVTGNRTDYLPATVTSPQTGKVKNP